MKVSKKEVKEENKDDKKKSGIFKITENSKDKKITFKDPKINEFRKNLIMSTDKKRNLYRRQTIVKKNEITKKNYLWKFNSIKPTQNNISVKHKTVIDSHHNNHDNGENIRKTQNTRKEIMGTRRSKKISSMVVHQKQYERMFTDVESLILGKIEINDIKRNQILEEKKTLEEQINFFDNNNKYKNEMISQNEKILSRLKEENQNLTQKLKSVSKITNEEVITENILEKKKITNINNLISMIKLKPIDFRDKYKTSKLIFLIKIIELIITDLISKKNKYLSEPKLRETLKNFLFVLENDKKKRMNKLNKNLLYQQIEDKKEKALERATRIRFFSYRKFDLNHFKNKRNKYIKEKESNKTVNDNQYEKWILYD